MANVKLPASEMIEAQPYEAARLYKILEQMNTPKDADYFERCFEFQQEGARQLFIIRCENQDAGYGILNWQPKYGLFKKLGIPEIQDLNVIPGMRRRGLATLFINYCENLACAKGMTQMGIGVGMTRRYGPAQQLYIKLGYVPDGSGLTYDRQCLEEGALKPNDDNLCLMMVKNLHKSL